MIYAHFGAYAPKDRCVCNQVILSEPYFGMEMGEDQDPDAIVYFDRTHDRCLAEWGLATYPDDPLGIRHCGERFEDPDPVIRRRLDELMKGYLGGAS